MFLLIPKYNIVFRGNTYWNQRVTVDFGNGEETGRMYGYQILAQLYNTNSSKELRGIEFPKGDITGKIKILLERTNKDTKVTEDITDSAFKALMVAFKGKNPIKELKQDD
mgnify:CR=1 FL=1